MRKTILPPSRALATSLLVLACAAAPIRPAPAQEAAPREAPVSRRALDRLQDLPQSLQLQRKLAREMLEKMLEFQRALERERRAQGSRPSVDVPLGNFSLLLDAVRPDLAYMRKTLRAAVCALLARPACRRPAESYGVGKASEAAASEPKPSPEETLSRLDLDAAIQALDALVAQGARMEDTRPGGPITLFGLFIEANGALDPLYKEWASGAKARQSYADTAAAARALLSAINDYRVAALKNAGDAYGLLQQLSRLREDRETERAALAAAQAEEQTDPEDGAPGEVKKTWVQQQLEMQEKARELWLNKGRHPAVKTGFSGVYDCFKPDL